MRKINWTYVTARLIVLGFLGLAAWFSYTHQHDLAAFLGCTDNESVAWPLIVDGLAAFGWLMRRPSLADSTRRLGMKVMLGGATLSLLGNVFAGHTWGSRIFGAIVVGAAVTFEQLSDRLRPAEADGKAAEAEVLRLQAAAAAQAAAKRSASALQGAATRKANAAAKAAQPQPAPIVVPAAQPVAAPHRVRPTSRRAPLGRPGPGWLTPAIAAQVPSHA